MNELQQVVEAIIRNLHLRIHLSVNARAGKKREGIVGGAAHTFHYTHADAAPLVQIITKRPQGLADLFNLLLLEIRIRLHLARVIRELIIRLDAGRRLTT